MDNTKRNIIQKVRLSQTEQTVLMTNYKKSNAKNVSEYIRDKILSDEKQTNMSKEQTRHCKIILSGICSSLNQLKAGVEPQAALDKLEKGVNELCLSLN